MTHLGVAGFLLLAAAAAPTDRVSLDGISSEATLLIDATYPQGCENDRVFAGSASSGEMQIPVGDANSTSECQTELVVLSNANAIGLTQPAFTSQSDDVSVPLSPILQVPVFTLVLRMTPEDDQDWIDWQNRATGDIGVANVAFAAGGAGIEFIHEDLEFIVKPSEVKAIRDLAEEVTEGLGGADTLRAKLRQLALEKIPDLNNIIVAFRLESDQFRGMHFREEDDHSTGLLLIGSDGTASTLGHELGHAMSLDHVNYWGYDVRSEEVGMYCVAYGLPPPYDGVCDFREQNLMWSETDLDRDYITAGQAFRTAVNARSFVNDGTPPLRPPSEPRRDCEDWRYSGDCPYIDVEGP
jgi:hypothetical protein